MKGSDNAALRTYAVYALGFFGPRATPGLRASLDDGDRDVRYNAASALARRGDMAAAGNLREMLTDKDLQTLLASLPDTERPNRIESIELAALDALEAAVAAGKLELPRSLRGEVDALSSLGARLGPKPGPRAFEKSTSRPVKKRPSDGPKPGR